MELKEWIPVSERLPDYDGTYICTCESLPETVSLIFSIYDNVKAANNDVLNGIQEVTKYLNYGLYQVHDSSVETIKEYQQYAWDDKSVEDAVIKESDHHMDADRYLIYTVARQYNRWIV